MTTEIERISRLEGIVEEIRGRLDDINRRIDDTNHRIDEVNIRLTSLESRIMMMWITTILALLAGFISIWFRG